MRMGIPHETLEFDAAVCAGIEYLWESGDGRGLAGHLISGLEFFCDFLHGQLKGSWRLWRAWGRQELPTHAAPFTPLMAWSLAGVLSEWGFLDCAVLIILGFETFMRTGELVSIQVKHLVYGTGHDTRAHISLPFTKVTARSGGIESVVCDDPLVVRALHITCWLDARRLCATSHAFAV